jgi:hypothetical protein
MQTVQNRSLGQQVVILIILAWITATEHYPLQPLRVYVIYLNHAASVGLVKNTADFEFVSNT